MIAKNTGLWVAVAVGALATKRSECSRWSSPRFSLLMKKSQQEDVFGIKFSPSVGKPSGAECVDWLLRSAQ